jgi:hypothetical protein
MKRIRSTYTKPVLLIDDIWRYIIRMYYMIRYKEQLQELIDTVQSNRRGFVTPREGIKVPLYDRCIRYAATAIFYDISNLYWNRDGELYAIKVHEYLFYLNDPATRMNGKKPYPVIIYIEELSDRIGSRSWGPELSSIICMTKTFYPKDEQPVSLFTVDMDLLPREILGSLNSSK